MWNLMEKHCHSCDEAHFEICYVSYTNRETVSEIMDEITHECHYCKRTEFVLFFNFWGDSNFFLLFTMVMVMRFKILVS